MLGGTVAVAAGSRAATMITAVAIVAAVIVIGLVSGVRSARSRATAAALVAVCGFTPAVVLFGWFYVRNIGLYGDATGSRYLLERFDRTRRGTPLAQFMSGTLWARIYRQLPTISPLPRPTSRSANFGSDVAAGLAAIGLAVCLATRCTRGGRRGWRSCQLSPSALAVCMVVVVVVAATVAAHTSGGGSVTARYAFPALGTFAAMVTIGLDRLTRVLPLVAVVTLAFWSAHVLPSRVSSDIERLGATPTPLSGATTSVLGGVGVASLVVLVAVLFAATISAAPGAPAARVVHRAENASTGLEIRLGVDSVMTESTLEGLRRGGRSTTEPRASAAAGAPQHAPSALTIGYGLTAEPPPGCTSRCRCGVAALPVRPT